MATLLQSTHHGQLIVGKTRYANFLQDNSKWNLTQPRDGGSSSGTSEAGGEDSYGAALALHSHGGSPSPLSIIFNLQLLPVEKGAQARMMLPQQRTGVLPPSWLPWTGTSPCSPSTAAAIVELAGVCSSASALQWPSCGRVELSHVESCCRIGHGMLSHGKSCGKLATLSCRVVNCPIPVGPGSH